MKKTDSISEAIKKLIYKMTFRKTFWLKSDASQNFHYKFYHVVNSSFHTYN